MTRYRPVLHTLTAAVLCAVITACSSSTVPDSDFGTFTGDGGNRVSFPLDMSDTACAYSLSLMARFIKGEGPESVTMDITVTSPSGVRGHETVTLPSDYEGLRRHLRGNPPDTRIRLAGTPSYYDVSWKYRSGIIPPERGEWRIDIALRDGTSGIQGAGYILEKIQPAEGAQQ